MFIRKELRYKASRQFWTPETSNTKYLDIGWHSLTANGSGYQFGRPRKSSKKITQGLWQAFQHPMQLEYANHSTSLLDRASPKNCFWARCLRSAFTSRKTLQSISRACVYLALPTIHHWYWPVAIASAGNVFKILAITLVALRSNSLAACCAALRTMRPYTSNLSPQDCEYWSWAAVWGMLRV